MIRLLLVFAAGSLCALAFAPFHFILVLPVAFSILLAQTIDVKGWRAFGYGWLFSFGYFLAGLYWVTNALFVDIARFWWALPLALCALPMGLAVFQGFALWLANRYTKAVRVLVFAFAWAAAEWLRGHLFTGFPWLLTGYAWNGVLPVMQLSSVVGIYGLSLFTIILAVTPMLPRQTKWGLVTLLLAAYGWGWLHLDDHPMELDFTRTSLRIVQPNVPQKLKVDSNALMERFEMAVTATNKPGDADIIIWPETAMPFVFDDETFWRPVRDRLQSKSLLLAGVVRREIPDGRYYNSMMAVNGAGDVEAVYDKSHLVPFGEYIPFQKYLPFNPLGGDGFSAGLGPETQHIKGIPPFSALICYEGIFPAKVVNEADRPEWLLNITNDGWYGISTGPHQHFEINRVRAIEEGLPLVRAANTGVSGVVDAYGRVLAQTVLGEAATLDISLPKAGAPTLYSHYGDLPFLIVLIGGFGLLFKRR